MTEKLNIPVPKSKRTEVNKAVQVMNARTKAKVDIATSKMKTEQAIRKAEEVGRKVALDKTKADQKWDLAMFKAEKAIAKANVDNKLRQKMGIVAFNEYKKKREDIESKVRAGKSSVLRNYKKKKD